MPLSRQEIEWNYYSNGYNQRNYRGSSNAEVNPRFGYTQNLQNVTEISRYKQRKLKNKRKLNKKGKVALFLLTLFFMGVVAPSFLRNVTKPVLLGLNPNSKVKTDIYALYSPTSKYLYNTDFMNIKALVGVPKKTTMQPIFTTKELTGLKNVLQAQIKANPKIEASVFVWDTSNGNYVDINGETPYPAASIIKIPVLISLYKAIEAGKFTKHDTMTLEEYYRSEGSGGLQYKAQGTVMSLDNLARIMITESDNSATNMIMSKIGSMTSVNADIKSWGLKNTRINTWLPDMGGTNYTTTRDLTVMLHNLDNESFLSLESRADIFDFMGHVKNNRLLVAGIPSNASIAHKTGDIGSALGDAGIIYSPNGRKYIVSIMVKRPYNDISAKEFIVKASETIYNYMTTY